LPTVHDTDLARIVEAWTMLPAHIKAAVLALVNTGGAAHLMARSGREREENPP
jgi:hypothetical protein